MVVKQEVLWRRVFLKKVVVKSECQVPASASPTDRRADDELQVKVPALSWNRGRAGLLCELTII